MELGGAEGPNRAVVGGRDVAHVRDEAVVRKECVEPPHHPVADDLCDDRRGRDGSAPRVSVDDRPVRRRGRPEAEAVDKACLGGWMEICEHGPETGEIRAVEAVPVDRANRNDADADRGRAGRDRLEERLALLHGDLLRVVQRRERPHASPAQLLVVEEDARDDEGAGERSASGLVGPGDEANVELPIEPEKSLAAGSSHAAENSR